MSGVGRGGEDDPAFGRMDGDGCFLKNEARELMVKHLVRCTTLNGIIRQAGWGRRARTASMVRCL